MNLIEGKKTGKPYRQAGDLCWLDPDEDIVLNSEQILATNWEVEPDPDESVTVMRSQIREIFQRFIGGIDKGGADCAHYYQGSVVVIDEERLCKKLGLKP